MLETKIKSNIVLWYEKKALPLQRKNKTKLILMRP
jgi:hypothetical protein